MQWTSELIAEAQALYDSGLQPAKVADRLVQLRRVCRVSAADVRDAINTHRTVPASSGDLRAEIRRIRETEGLSLSAIAQRLGVTRSKVDRACRGMPCPKGAKVENAGSAYTLLHPSRAQEPAERLIQLKAFEPVEIPAWVPDHLHELYEHTAQTQDEHVAARVCRDLKRGHSVTFTRGAA